MAHLENRSNICGVNRLHLDKTKKTKEIKDNESCNPFDRKKGHWNHYEI